MMGPVRRLAPGGLGRSPHWAVHSLPNLWEAGDMEVFREVGEGDRVGEKN